MTTEEHQQSGIEPDSYRLPEATRPGRVRLQVADLHRSLDFYEDILGLRVTDREETELGLGSQEANAPLVELVERPGARAKPLRGRLGLFHVALLLPSRGALGQFFRHIREKDIQIGMSDHHVSEALYLTDPDRLGLEVYADRSRDAWEHAEDGEIAMTTEPLDTDSLLEAAPDAPWNGMPASTTVGHVHLHVGGLDKAEHFYHEALGLDKTNWSYPGALFLSAGGYHHHLGTNVWAGDVPPAGEDEAHLLEWTIALPSVDDVEAATRSLETAGYDVTRTGETCLTQDPWGTALRLTPGD